MQKSQRNTVNNFYIVVAWLFNKKIVTFLLPIEKNLPKFNINRNGTFPKQQSFPDTSNS